MWRIRGDGMGFPLESLCWRLVAGEQMDQREAHGTIALSPMAVLLYAPSAVPLLYIQNLSRLRCRPSATYHNHATVMLKGRSYDAICAIVLITGSSHLRCPDLSKTKYLHNCLCEVL